MTVRSKISTLFHDYAKVVGRRPNIVVISENDHLSWLDECSDMERMDNESGKLLGMRLIIADDDVGPIVGYAFWVDA